MMIKTITCHDVYNYGASLQAYALKEYLTGLNNNVEIINYKPDYLSGHYKLGVVGNPIYDKPVIRYVYILLKFPKRLFAKWGKRKREFDSFTKNYLQITKKRYTSNEELKASLPEADIYIAGSDQIWNTLFQNGKDPAFYLDFVPQDKRKISYAASFSTTSVADGYKEKVKKWLSGIDYISVREKSGIQILKNLGIENGIQVMDPVFLLDKEQWIQVEKPLKVREKYLLLYDFDDNPKIKMLARQIAREKCIKIYSMLKSDIADKSFYNEGPNAFVWLIHNAEYIISNSFHATAFSIIFNKQFIVCKRIEGINTRMLDLTSILELSDTVFSDNVFQLKTIDYDRTNYLLDEHIKKSKEFLKKAIR